MKIIRYSDSIGHIGLAALQGGRYFELTGNPVAGAVSMTPRLADVVTRLAPVVPTAILCVGLNYRKHAAETNAAVPKQPVLFCKGVNTLQHPDGPIYLPRHLRSDEVDYECELAVVIGTGPNGKACRNVSRANALQYVAGYTCANDISARDWQLKRGGGQWCRGKFFDTFAPLGPFLVTPESITNPNALGIRTELNGVIVQNSNTADMIFSVPELIEFLSGSTTLLPGTVILTGTPEGVGMASKPPRWLRVGDTITIEIENIGRLTNSVEEEPNHNTPAPSV